MIVTTDNILDVVDKIRVHELKSSDTETYGVHYSDRMFSLIVACGDEAYYFNFKKYEGGLTDPHVLDLQNPRVKYSIQAMFSSGGTWFFHNASFDMHRLRKEGIEVIGTIWDTKVHARVLHNNRMDYTLDALTKGQKYQKTDIVDKYIDEHKLWTQISIKGKKKKEKLKHFDRVPFDIIYEYGCLDALSTLELGINQMKAYDAIPSLYSVRDNEMAITRVFFEMESAGVCINPQYIIESWKKEESLVLEAEKSFLDLTGYNLKDTNKKQLVEILKSSGESINYSEKGNPVLDSDALDEMTSPVARIIQKIRFHEKRITAFYSTFMYYRDSDNIIHANADQAGTETGRVSMSKPNLQQLSKDEDEEANMPAIRGCFIPRPKKCFVQWDYSQQEYRLMADYAGEKGLLTKIAAGYDVHEATAELVGVTRTEAKRINFAVLYGAGAAKLAAMLGISLAEARKLIGKYFAALPMVENFITKVIGTGKNRGFIFNWIGRRSHIANREWAYILPNHLIQGSGADVMKIGIVRVYKMLKAKAKNSNIVLTVHDSLIIEMAEEDFHLIPEVTTILEAVYESKNGVILKTDLEHSWVSLAKKDMIKGAPNVRSA